MTTPYSDVYDIFLSQITDYDFLSFTQEQIDTLLLKFLKISIPKFKLCNKDLADRDDAVGIFNSNLNDMEKLILARLMISAWIEPSINNMQLLKMVLNDKDFKIYSQANHLKELKDLRDNNEDIINSLIIDYTYDITGMEGLR